MGQIVIMSKGIDERNALRDAINAYAVVPADQRREPGADERVELRPVLTPDLDDVLEARVRHPRLQLRLRHRRSESTVPRRIA